MAGVSVRWGKCSNVAMGGVMAARDSGETTKKRRPGLPSGAWWGVVLGSLTVWGMVAAAIVAAIWYH